MTVAPVDRPAAAVARERRLDELFAELSQLCGQRNAVDGRIVEIVAELERDGLWSNTGARSVAALVAWKAGVSPNNAGAIAAVAHRCAQFPRLTAGLRAGRFSLDQVAVIAQGGADGSDAHYTRLAEHATVAQLRTAVKLQPRPEPDPDPDAAPTPGPVPGISKTGDGKFDFWRITLPHAESATFQAALAAHRDALIGAWRHQHPTGDGDGTTTGGGDGDGTGGDGADGGAGRAPMPTTLDAFLRLVEFGWDAEATARPHAQHTTVVVHVDVAERIAALHVGPVLPDSVRRYLSCDATCEVWFERDGQVIGHGRSTRTVGRRLRRILEQRDRCCVVPGCSATAGLHAHHIKHWEDGGETTLDNLCLLCPYHHRMHHRGLLNITGPATRLRITEAGGRPLTPGSLARPPQHPPPQVPPYPGPTGERAQWLWYQPFQPQPPPTTQPARE